VHRAERGEIWLIDLGMAAKTRPAVVLSVAYDDRERAVVSYVPRTTALRGTRFEVPHTARGFARACENPSVRFQLFSFSAFQLFSCVQSSRIPRITSVTPKENDPLPEPTKPRSNGPK
jgi:hypothetical protein